MDFVALIQNVAAIKQLSQIGNTNPKNKHSNRANFLVKVKTTTIKYICLPLNGRVIKMLFLNNPCFVCGK